MEEEKKEVVEIEKADNLENTEKVIEVNTEPKGENKTTKEPKKERKGFCIAAMVLGIVALVLFLIWYISIPCAILAIIFGILGIKTVHKGMAIAGLVTGIVGLVIWIFLVVIIFMLGFALGISDILDNGNNSYRNNHHYDWDYEYDYDYDDWYDFD